MSAPWILDHAPEVPFLDPRRAHPPGVSPLGDAPWLVAGPDYAAQMAERARLLAARRALCVDALPAAAAAVAELYAAVLADLALRPDFEVAAGRIRRPDGAVVAPDPADPLGTLGLLAAEDFCLMLPGEEETVLGAAVLCFPSRWRLADKIGRPLTAIHEPVPVYDANLARRVNRIFAAVRPGAPVWRANWTVHATPELHLLPGDGHAGDGHADGGALMFRSERQVIRRLPESGAVCFSIRTFVTPLARLRPPERAALAALVGALDGAERDYKGGPAMQAAILAALAD